MHKRGISPLIGTVLIIAFTVAIALAAFLILGPYSRTSKGYEEYCEFKFIGNGEEVTYGSFGIPCKELQDKCEPMGCSGIISETKGNKQYNCWCQQEVLI